MKYLKYSFFDTKVEKKSCAKRKNIYFTCVVLDFALLRHRTLH